MEIVGIFILSDHHRRFASLNSFLKDVRVKTDNDLWLKACNPDSTGTITITVNAYIFCIHSRDCHHSNYHHIVMSSPILWQEIAISSVWTRA